MMIFILEKAAVLEDHVCPILVPERQKKFIDLDVIAAGWGRAESDTNDGPMSDKLKKCKLRLIQQVDGDFDRMWRDYTKLHKNKRLHAYTFETDMSNSKCKLCKGDSGE